VGVDDYADNATDKVVPVSSLWSPNADEEDFFNIVPY
jgi:hypothetical protein